MIVKYYFHLLSQYKEERVAKTYEQELNDIVERDPLAPQLHAAMKFSIGFPTDK